MWERLRAREGLLCAARALRSRAIGASSWLLRVALVLTPASASAQPLFVSQEATLLATGGAENDDAGRSVAISADGTRAVVGVFWDDTAAGVDAGSARVFARSGTNWTEE